MRYFITGFVLFFISTPLLAFTNAANSATGGAGVAAADPGVAAFMNPAMLIHIPGRQLILNSSNYETAISLSDSSPDNVFPAALSYIKKISPFNARNISHETTFSMADFITQRLTVGAAFHFNQPNYNDKSYRQVAGDLGLTYIHNDEIGAAVVVKNIANNASADMPAAVTLKPLVIFGANYIYKSQLRIRLDLSSQEDNEFSQPLLAGGLESIINRWTVFRLGYFNDIKLKTDGWSLGFGFNGPRFSLNYAYLSGNNVRESAQSVDLVIPF